MPEQVGSVEAGELVDGQGDVATLPLDAKLDGVQLLTPRRLYFLWESRQWAAGALDYAQDRRDWDELPDERREELLQSLAPFFAGEERVAALFAPVLLAADDEQEAAFLSTQQVDEARHMHFFDAFWSEVFAGEPASGAAVDGARARCNDAFAELFDRRLANAVDRLRLDPRDADAKVEAVTIYHLIVEATLGLTAQHFVLDYLQRTEIFPAIAAGFRNVKRDEHRHVAWGTWYLRRKCREDDRYGAVVTDTILELLPVAASVLVEGESAVCDGLDDCEFLGYPSAELNYYALVGLARRLKVIGGATEEAQHFAASGAWRAARVL